MIDNIANEIMIASQLLHTNNLSRIAGEIGYRPLLLISAMYRAQETGKFSYDKNTDTISIAEDVEVDRLSVTEGMQELIDLLEQFITYLNAEEKDTSVEELVMMLGGTPDLHIKIAAKVSDKLTTYEYIPPKNKKSTYTFVTLKENLFNQWGKKQFDAKKSKARRAGKRAEQDTKPAK